ncbi:hypothetical protein [Mycobacterium sp.]|uniref:hypothetical protein n=1 Tax=Mycobacterium sp. TaxID=1785 RepID=UPI003C723D2C
MDQQDRAMRGWLGEPPPERERTPLSHALKWRIMMGNGQFLTEEDKDRLSKIRAKAIRQATEQHDEC